MSPLQKLGPTQGLTLAPGLLAPEHSCQPSPASLTPFQTLGDDPEEWLFLLPLRSARDTNRGEQSLGP